MADTTDDQGLDGLDLTTDGSGDLDERVAGATDAAPDKGFGAGARLVGFLALILGILGMLLSLIALIVIIRVGFGASGAVNRMMEPVDSAINRLETRVDATDDLVTRQGVAPEVLPELQARADGLVDVATVAHQGFEAVEDHAVYRYLPASLSTVGDSLAQFETSAEAIDDAVDRASAGQSLGGTAATEAADQLDFLQGRVTEVRSEIDDAADSLRTWIRIGSLGGVLGSLWGVWAQWCLARRGARAIRGRDI